MNTNIRNVSLSFCCQEDWNTFEKIDQRSRHCGTCQHRVIDFTNATAADFAEAKKSGAVCGRFKSSQLSAAFLIGLAASATLGSCTESEVNQPAPPSPEITIDLEKLEMDTNMEEFTTLGVVFI